MKTKCNQKCRQGRQCECAAVQEKIDKLRAEFTGAAIVIVVVTALFALALVSGSVVYDYYLGGA